MSEEGGVGRYICMVHLIIVNIKLVQLNINGDERLSSGLIVTH